MSHKLELELSDELLHEMQAVAGDFNLSVEALAIYAIRYYLEDLDEEDSDEDILWNLRRSLTEIRDGKTISAREMLGELREEEKVVNDQR